MPAGGSRRAREAREKLRNVIEACRAVEVGKLDPFSIPIEDLIEVVRAFFPLWEEPEDLSLDAEALEAISGVIKAQSEWVRERSTKLYRDPFLIEEKLNEMEVDELVDLFLRIWHPIVELEQLTPLSLEMALKYWLELPSKGEEVREGPEGEPGVVPEVGGPGPVFEEIQEALEALWDELRARARGGSVGYWEFVMADTYSEALERAYLTSFLITYGYASLGFDPFREELVLKPRRRPRRRPREKATSIVIPLDYEGWLRHAQEGR